MLVGNSSLLNPLQIYTDFVLTQVNTREKRIFVNNSKQLLIKLIKKDCF